MNQQYSFNFDPGDAGNQMVTCPACLGSGKIEYRKLASHLYRRTDPETSAKGAKHLESKDIGCFTEKSVKGKLLMIFGDSEQPLTREEAAGMKIDRNFSPIRFETARKRVSELLEIDYIKVLMGDDDKPLVKINSLTEKDCELLMITPLGIAALTRMKATGSTR